MRQPVRRFIVEYEAHPSLKSGSVFLSDSWANKREGIPEFVGFELRARMYDDFEAANRDASLYHPGSGYLPGRVAVLNDYRPRIEGPDQETSARRNSDLEKRFTYHAPKEGQPEKYQAIRGKAKELAYLIGELCPTGREHSLALTKVEEAVFWANAAIARN